VYHQTYNCLHTLSGHEIYSFKEIKFYGDHLVSASVGNVKVWNIRTGVCLHTIPILGSLGNMALQENILITANQDNTVKIWNILTGSCLQTLGGPNKHSKVITCIQYDNKYVVTASKDGTIKLWDFKSGQFFRNLLELEGEELSRMKMKDAKIAVFTFYVFKNSHAKEIVVLNFDIKY